MKKVIKHIIVLLEKWKITLLWSMEETFYQTIKNNLRAYDNIRKLQLVNLIVTELGVY